MTIPPPRFPDASPPGFVLIGVVMLILALTILGLSLFGLSSYESEFLLGSRDRQQAFQSAQGGIERAKYALAVSESLQTVQFNLPPGVLRTFATQVQSGNVLSSGPIEWNGDDIHLTVTGYAADTTQTQTVTGRFRPQQVTSFYKRLFTSAGTALIRDQINIDPVPGLRQGTAFLSGGFWQIDSDTSWTAVAGSYTPKGIRLSPSVPTPDVTSFIDAHIGSATPVVPIAPDSTQYVFSVPPGQVGYFYSPDSPRNYNLEITKFTTIQVGGYAVWMIRRGVRFDEMATIERLPGSPNACLVIIAGPNNYVSVGSRPDVGVWFFGGLRSTNVSTILVSNGYVVNEQFSSYQLNTFADRLSIFGGAVEITGPRSDFGAEMTLGYPPSMNSDVDFLSSRGALPNSSALIRGDFALVPGTWKQNP